MKRISYLLLFCILLGICGCTALGTPPATLEKDRPIPENGVIPGSVFESLHQQNQVAVFHGESGKIRYAWTIFGSDVTACNDQNLQITITQISDQELHLQYTSDHDFGFSPMLSLYLIQPWKTSQAEVRTPDGTVLCTAAVAGTNRMILNFSCAVQSGELILTAVDIPDPVLSSDSVSAGTSFEPTEPTGSDDSATDPIAYTCTFSIECSSIFNHLSELEPNKLGVLPSNGIIFPAQTVTVYEGESVYDVLLRICKEQRIHLESSLTPLYNSAYIEGIHNLYEFDCGAGAGWMYRVDGWYPSHSCSKYRLKPGQVVEFRYTCNLGKDIDGSYASGNNSQ